MENKKLLMARDVILAFLMAQGFTVEETKKVLQMCEAEIEAEKKRTGFSEVKKEDSDGEDNK